jgi:hypothetical protein
MFFPAPSEPTEMAVALCRSCEVQGACLAWALDVGDCHGVWGATTPRERRAMLVAWRAGQGAADPVPVPLTVAARALPAAGTAPATGAVTAAGPATASRPVPVRIGRRLGLVPGPRSGRPVDRPCSERGLVERVAS